MTKRKIKSNITKIIGIALIFLGFLIIILEHINDYFINKNEMENVENFFEVTDENSNSNILKSDNITKTNTKDNKYIAILEIPSISLKKGLVDINDPDNTISKNVQILKESDMPNIVNGNFILAGHSGNGKKSFFNEIHKLKKEDLIYVYYNEIKYVYSVEKVYTEKKDGDISIKKDYNKTTITLTTCSQNPKGNQVIVIGELKNKEKY